ncbi:hypothetical protein L0Y69_02665 [bacterium]|nr:hypothetical protein [bacterium]
MKKREIGVSEFVFFPLNLIPFGIGHWLIGRIAKKAGLKLQLLPTRGIAKWVLSRLEVVAYEDAWNTASFIDKLLQRKIPGTWIDFVLFGSRKRVNKVLSWLQEVRPNAIRVDLPGGVMEISPDRYHHHLGWYLRSSVKVCWDPWHVRDFNLWTFPEFATTATRLASLRALLAADKVTLFQVQFSRTDKSEAEDFLRGRHTEVSDMIKCLVRYERVTTPIVLEIDPRYFWIRKVLLGLHRPSHVLRLFAAEVERHEIQEKSHAFSTGLVYIF